MDLDFSFTLVSSLTPLSRTNRTPLTNSNLSLKSLKNKRTISKLYCNKICHHKDKEDKENLLPKEQLMNKNGCFKPNTETKSSDNNISGELFVDMANIAVRRNRGRRIAKASPLQVTDAGLHNPVEEPQNKKSSITSNNDLLCSTSNESEILNIRCSEVEGNREESSNVLSSSSHVQKKYLKRKSPRLNRLNKTSLSSSVESPCSEVKTISTKSNNNFSEHSHLNKLSIRRSPRISDTTENSLSPAYDNYSFQTRFQLPVKVIPGTPESDESLKNNSNEKRKASLENIKVKKNKDRNSFFNRSINIREKNGLVICDKKGVSRQDDKVDDNYWINTRSSGGPKKTLISGNEAFWNNMFRLESSIKDQPDAEKKEVGDIKEKADVSRAKKDKRKLSISPILKELNTKEIDKKDDPVKKKKCNSKETGTRKSTSEVQEENMCRKYFKEKDSGKKSKQRITNKYSKNSPCKGISPKSTLVPPTDLISKFEHINNWLKDTEERSIIVVSNDLPFDDPKGGVKTTRQKKPVSLSPRIKRKLKVAQSTLQEEQKLFEDLYGGDLAKRLSDDIEDLSIDRSQESVELSEKVLEKLYGTVWKKDAVLPQSEPRKSKKSSSKKKAPLTERKKPRTSIYDVFSSSSSEDRFEEFLESVRRGKLKLRQRRSGRPGTPDFINDAESGSDNSLVFYQNIVSSAVKDDINKLRRNCSENQNNPPNINRRRLSFGSSKDDSENGKSDIKLSVKGKKTSNNDGKKGNLKPRSKKKIEKDLEDINSSLSGFTLVTPIKIQDRNSDRNRGTRIKNIIEHEVPKSVGKSKTPKQAIPRDGITNTEEKLRVKYLGDGDFKVPTSLKTPTKHTKRDVPSSPALSFLSSLSEMTAGLPCHPDALVYKKDFKKKREELTKKLFNLYNKEVFESQLPADLLIQWNTRMTSTSGFCYNKRMYRNNEIFRSARIVLSTKILDRADRLRDTLMHELCHAATWIINGTTDGHGANWRAWAGRANRRFPELPVIKRCHDYAINTKFTYKCMSCGYCIGRHTKSLDTDRKRCGYCFGKFQVFVTSKMSATSATSGSDSVKMPRNPTGFALFVKENYAVVKKENNVPHGQVMKLLSQKFAEVKISKQTANEVVLN